MVDGVWSKKNPRRNARPRAPAGRGVASHVGGRLQRRRRRGNRMMLRCQAAMRQLRRVPADSSCASTKISGGTGSRLATRRAGRVTSTLVKAAGGAGGTGVRPVSNVARANPAKCCFRTSDFGRVLSGLFSWGGPPNQALHTYGLPVQLEPSTAQRG